MLLAVEYKLDGRIRRVIKSIERRHVSNIFNSNSRNVGIVTKAPADISQYGTKEIRENFKVRNVDGYSVELEHGKG